MDNRTNTLSPLDDVLLTRAQLAARWSSSIKTVQRRERGGLRVMRAGRIVRYRLSDVIAFEAANSVTSEA